MNDFFKNNDFFKAFQNIPQFQGFQGVQGFKAPQVDVNKMLTLQRKNLEALSAAGQAINQSTQAIARRGAEFVRDNVEEALNASRDLMTGATTPDKAAAAQGDLAKQIFQGTMEQIREVSEMASKAQFEAFDILSNRFSRSIDEAKDLAPKTKAA